MTLLPIRSLAGEGSGSLYRFPCDLPDRLFKMIRPYFDQGFFPASLELFFKCLFCGNPAKVFELCAV